MQFVFQNPLWLFGALAVIPLLAHLFSRTRPRRREFPSLRLLREAVRRVTRVRRPRDRWLLLLRTLAMAALALAFLQPWLLSRFASNRGVAKTAVFVVDVTASMGYPDGATTRLAQAASATEEVLGALPPSSKANIVWVRAHPSGVFPEPGSNLEFLRQSLRSAVVRPEGGDVAGALDLALKQLAASQGSRELIIVSDFQKSAWGRAPLSAPSGVRLTRLAVGRDDVANVGLADLTTEPDRPVAGQDARVVCRVRNFSAEPRRVTIFVEAGESRLSQAVELTAWSETLASLPVKFPQAGLAPLKASITEDRFPGDDVGYGLAEVRGALQVGVAGPADDETARVWLRALGALDAVGVRRLAPDAIGQGNRLDVLFVAHWKGEGIAALSALHRRGCALILQPADGLDPAALRALRGEPLAGAAPRAAVEFRDAPGWALAIVNEDHPIFALFAKGEFGDPVNARFLRRVTAPASLGGRPLLAYEDGVSALTLLDSGQAGEVQAPIAWWNLDLDATEWPTHSAFLPFLGEFLRYLAQQSGARSIHSVASGDQIHFDAGAAIDPADVQLVDERDHAVKFHAESPQSPGQLVSETAPPPGSYRWMAKGSILDRTVINFPESESDLRRLTAAELERSGGGAVVSDAARARLADWRDGQPLWPWCLAAAAILFLLEGLIVWLLPAGGSAESERAVPANVKEEQRLVSV